MNEEHVLECDFDPLIVNSELLMAFYADNVSVNNVVSNHIADVINNINHFFISKEKINFLLDKEYEVAYNVSDDPEPLYNFTDKVANIYFINKIQKRGIGIRCRAANDMALVTTYPYIVLDKDKIPKKDTQIEGFFEINLQALNGLDFLARLVEFLINGTIDITKKSNMPTLQ